MLTDGHTSITVSIDYSADANAAAKWGLAGGAHSKMLLFRAAGKGRGGAGIWHMIDGLSIASEACLDLWQGSACGARPPKPRAHWSICYLHPKWMGHSCGGSQWGHCRKNPDAFCHCTAVFCVVMGLCVSSQKNIVSHESVYEQSLLVNSRRAQSNLIQYKAGTVMKLYLQ